MSQRTKKLYDLACKWFRGQECANLTTRVDALKPCSLGPSKEAIQWLSSSPVLFFRPSLHEPETRCADRETKTTTYTKLARPTIPALLLVALSNFSSLPLPQVGRCASRPPSTLSTKMVTTQRTTRIESAAKVTFRNGSTTAAQAALTMGTSVQRLTALEGKMSQMEAMMVPTRTRRL